jgi:hypothetical protein
MIRPTNRRVLGSTHSTAIAILCLAFAANSHSAEYLRSADPAL